MYSDNPENGEALIGANEILADRYSQVFSAVKLLDQIVTSMPEATPQPATNNVVNLLRNEEWEEPRKAA